MVGTWEDSARSLLAARQQDGGTVEKHVIRIREVVYQGEYSDRINALVVCSCGAKFDEIYKGFTDYRERLAASILNHKIEVLAAKLGVQFADGGELPRQVHAE